MRTVNLVEWFTLILLLLSWLCLVYIALKGRIEIYVENTLETVKKKLEESDEFYLFTGETDCYICGHVIEINKKLNEIHDEMSIVVDCPQCGYTNHYVIDCPLCPLCAGHKLIESNGVVKDCPGCSKKGSIEHD